MKISGLETLKGIAEGMKEEYARKTDLAAYSIEMQETAEAGCAATYRLTKDGVPVGVKAAGVVMGVRVKDGHGKPPAKNKKDIRTDALLA